MKNQQKALQERVKRLLFLNQYKDLKATSAYYSRSIQFLQYVAICYLLFIRIWRDPSWTLSTFGLPWIDNAAMRPLRPFCFIIGYSKYSEASEVWRASRAHEQAWSVRESRFLFTLFPAYTLGLRFVTSSNILYITIYKVSE